MLLAIEQGNTNTLFAVHDGESWIAQWRSATHSSRTADEYAAGADFFRHCPGAGIGAVALVGIFAVERNDMQPAGEARAADIHHGVVVPELLIDLAA